MKYKMENQSGSNIQRDKASNTRQDSSPCRHNKDRVRGTKTRDILPETRDTSGKQSYSRRDSGNNKETNRNQERPIYQNGRDQAEDIIKEILEEAGLVQAYFDPALGEVVLEVEKPGVAIGKSGTNVLDIVRQTHWSPNFKRSPPIPSMTIKQIRGFLYSKSKEREKVLRETGESIFRPIYQQSGDVRITFLGSSRQVGRSAILIKTRESEILMDCGINPGSRNAIGTYPRLDVEEFDLSRLDAVVISTRSLRPLWFPALSIQVWIQWTRLLQRTYVKRHDLTPERLYRCHKQGGKSPPYSPEDISEVILHTIPLDTAR